MVAARSLRSVLIAMVAIAPLVVLSSCCRDLLGIDTKSPTDRLQRNDDDTLTIAIHEFTPAGAEATFFNPHEVLFDKDRLDLNARPPVLPARKIRDSLVTPDRPIPDSATVWEPDYEIGLPISTERTTTDSLVVPREVGTPPRAVDVTYTITRHHVRMQMYRVVYTEVAIEAPPLPPREFVGEEPRDDRVDRTQPRYERWVTAVNQPEPWRVREVTVRVRFVATLPDVLGAGATREEAIALVRAVEGASTPVFAELYGRMVKPDE